MEQRWIQRWKDIMAACFKSGAKDATGTKVANQILSSIPRGLARKKYRKILKMDHGAYIFQRPFLRGLSTEGNLRFKIDWAGLIVGRKFTVFALFYFVFEGNFQVQAPGGLIFGGAI